MNSFFALSSLSLLVCFPVAAQVVTSKSAPRIENSAQGVRTFSMVNPSFIAGRVDGEAVEAEMNLVFVKFDSESKSDLFETESDANLVISTLAAVVRVPSAPVSVGLTYSSYDGDADTKYSSSFESQTYETKVDTDSSGEMMGIFSKVDLGPVALGLGYSGQKQQSKYSYRADFTDGVLEDYETSVNLNQFSMALLGKIGRNVQLGLEASTGDTDVREDSQSDRGYAYMPAERSVFMTWNVTSGGGITAEVTRNEYELEKDDTSNQDYNDYLLGWFVEIGQIYLAQTFETASDGTQKDKNAEWSVGNEVVVSLGENLRLGGSFSYNESKATSDEHDAESKGRGISAGLSLGLMI